MPTTVNTVAPSTPISEAAASSSAGQRPAYDSETKQLQDIVWNGIKSHTPYYNDSNDAVPDNSVFHTSYDWHSSVHAHWAALSMARRTGDTARQKDVLSRLTPEALEKERQFVKKNPTEDTYGQSWMLMLLSEMQRSPQGNNPTVDGFRKELEEQTIKRLEDSPFPERKGSTRPGSGAQSPLLGNHDSWLMSYALLKMSKPKDPRVLERMKGLESRIDSARGDIAKHTPQDGDFLYLPAVLAMIDRMNGKRSPYPAANIGPLPSGDPHGAGQAVMRLWPYAMDAANGDAGAAKLFDERLAEIFKRPELFKTDFKEVSHWIPQFLWMAIQLRTDGAASMF